MNSKAEYRQGKVARVAIIKGLEEKGVCWCRWVSDCMEALPWGQPG